MIWFEVAMFSCLGPLAVGGLDVVYIWESFQMNLIFMQNDQHRRFWRKILLFLEYVEEQSPFISLRITKCIWIQKVHDNELVDKMQFFDTK